MSKSINGNNRTKRKEQTTTGLKGQTTTGLKEQSIATALKIQQRTTAT